MERLPQRKRNRLEGYNYSAPGAYFVTICTLEKRCILSSIIVGEGLAPPAVHLSEIGKIAEQQLLALPERFPALEIINYVLMPNHIHILLMLRETEKTGGASPSPTVSTIMGAYKSLTTRLARPFLPGQHLFQRSFHEHVIRGERDYREIRVYIETNPAGWAGDRYFADMERID